VELEVEGNHKTSETVLVHSLYSIQGALRAHYTVGAEHDTDMETPKRSIVTIGGGTGTHTLLRGLRAYRDTLDLRVVVTMADSGGSTGRLRDEFGHLPIGDVRMALVALAREETDHDHLIRNLFMHRFDRGEGLSGHNFGNLFLTALTDILGSELAAIDAAARILGVGGTVLPVTTDNVQLVARCGNGVEVVGEDAIDTCAQRSAEMRIEQLSVRPRARANPEAIRTIENADLIVLGPGDLYTSLLANCVVDGVPEAIQRSRGRLLYIANLMTKAGQTTGMGTKEHVDEVARYTGRTPDAMLVNSRPLPEELLARYEAESEYPVHETHSPDSIPVIAGDFLAREEVTTQAGDTLRRSLIRHDPAKIAAAVEAYSSFRTRLFPPVSDA